MADMNIEVLNDVLGHLIDSRDGYEKAAEKVYSDEKLKSALRSRATARREIISEFQNQIKALGGIAKTSGTASGSFHRFWMDITALFENDREAALDAIEDGEERLQDLIDDHLKQHNISADTRELLAAARAKAREGEAFADRLEDAS